MGEIKKIWEYKGYVCLVMENGMGFLCGYVLLPKSNELYGTHYDDFYTQYGISAHGGLTFSQEISTVELGNAVSRFVGRAQKMWMIGFDCAHAGDVPFVFGKSPISFFDNIQQGHAWDCDEVSAEVEQLVEQIALVS